MRQRVKSNDKSARASTNAKIKRDLREEFDDEYVPKEDAEVEPAPRNDSISQEQHSQEQESEHGHENAPVHNNKQAMKERNSAMKKNSQHNLGKSSKQNWRPQQTQTYTNYKVEGLPNSIPRSYLLAMEHLQDLLETKDETISMLKGQLMQKQQNILDCESRINEILLKYNELMDICSFKQNEVEVIKRQMEELRMDKQLALKKAAKIIEPEFRPYIGTPMSDEDLIASGFRSRSRSTGLFVPHLYHEPLNTVSESKQIQQIYKMKRDIDVGRNQKNPSEDFESKVSGQLITKLFTDKLGPSLASVQRLPHSTLNPPPPSGKHHRDFISYQRQILRNEKELIALKYRMECLERKLSTNSKEDGVKMKIRKLSQQIQSKEKAINELKKV